MVVVLLRCSSSTTTTTNSGSSSARISSGVCSRGISSTHSARSHTVTLVAEPP